MTSFRGRVYIYDHSTDTEGWPDLEYFSIAAFDLAAENYMELLQAGATTAEAIQANIEETRASLRNEPDLADNIGPPEKDFTILFYDTPYSDEDKEMESDVMPMVQQTCELVIDRLPNGNPVCSIVGQGPDCLNAFTMAMLVIYERMVQAGVIDEDEYDKPIVFEEWSPPVHIPYSEVAKS